MSTEKTKVQMLQEYFENHYDEHMAEIERHNTVKGRMEEAFEKSDGTIQDAFYKFLDHELSFELCGWASTCIIYMPDFGVNSLCNRKGKVLIELISRSDQWEKVEDFFEFQLSKKSDLKGVKINKLQRPSYSNDDFRRYWNMYLSWEDAMPLVQRVLFSPLFRQRFLITMASRNFGSMTTHTFLSGMGQALAFRSCVLNE